MKPVGGELSAKSLSETIFFTDSGRSSLKLFIRSGNKNKKFLIPNFLCEVIENTLLQEQVEYEFYNILEDLTIDSSTVINSDFDVFYSINYFGQIHDLKQLCLEDKIVIEDNVFFYDFHNTNNFKNWFGFNSFRKVTPLADGSLVKTNLVIDSNQVKQNEAEFSLKKYQAKSRKYEYIVNSKGTEREYIKLFEDGESLLNTQQDIFNISKQSIYEMMKYDNHNEQGISKKYYDFLYTEFKSNCLNCKAQHYSFFVMKALKRDDLRKFLFSKNIFLPIHWPKISQDNQLYDEVISMPLFSHYTIDEMQYVADTIKEFYEKHTKHKTK